VIKDTLIEFVRDNTLIEFMRERTCETETLDFKKPETVFKYVYKEGQF
jgi:hypothetical protein